MNKVNFIVISGRYTSESVLTFRHKCRPRDGMNYTTVVLTSCRFAALWFRPVSRLYGCKGRKYKIRTRCGGVSLFICVATEGVLLVTCRLQVFVGTSAHIPERRVWDMTPYTYTDSNHMLSTGIKLRALYTHAKGPHKTLGR